VLCALSTKLIFLCTVLLLFYGQYSYSQDLYLEDFNLPSGTTVDNGTTAWSRDISNANLNNGGFFESRSFLGLDYFQGSGINGEAVWTSENIDISDMSSVQVSIEVSEFGNMEVSDYIRVYYKLDGGTETIFGDFNDDFGFTAQLISSLPISGSSLQVVVRVSNNSSFESHIFDNVQVYGSNGGPTLYSRGSGNWNGLLSWSKSALGGSPCFCTPDSNTNVVVGNSHAVSLNVDGGTRGLTIQDTGILTFTGNSSLAVSGDISISSSQADPLGIGTQTINLDGSINQTLSLNNEDLFNLTIDKSNGQVILAQPVNLLGTLSFLTPSELVSNGNLTLVSTSDGTDGNASIGTIPAGGAVTGDVTVQRYISGEGKIWRYISSPVTNATVADWQDDFPITGSFDDPSSVPGNNPSTPSLYHYGESISNGEDLLLGWIPYPTSGTAADNPILPGGGYTAYMYNSATPVNMEVTGPINQGSLDFDVSFAGSGWNLLGNPYPATIDWSNTDGWSRNDLANAIYVRNNENGNNNSVVASYVDGVGTNGGTGLVATGQAFWVQALGSSPSLQINERAKSGNTGIFFRQQEPLNLIRVTLAGHDQKDEAVIRFSDRASMEYDPEMDAIKLSNGGINLSTMASADVEMAINSIPMVLCQQTLELALSNTKPGNYHLLFTELSRLKLPYSAELIDHFTDEVTTITDSTTYSFTISSDTLTHRSRFSLSIQSHELAIQSVDHGVVCEPAAITLKAYSNLSHFPGLQYKWFEKANSDTPLEINTGEFNTPPISESRSYFVSVASTAGCESERVEVYVTLEQPDQPEISLRGANMLFSSYSSGNQWYHDGETIIDATSNNITIDQPGIYGLEVSIGNCKVYQEMEVHPSDLTLDGNSLIVYPTPASGTLNISLPDKLSQGVLEIAVYNTLGNLILQQSLEIVNLKGQLDISKLKSGVYLMEVYAEHNKFSSRFIKNQ